MGKGNKRTGFILFVEYFTNCVLIQTTNSNIKLKKQIQTTNSKTKLKKQTQKTNSNSKLKQQTQITNSNSQLKQQTHHLIAGIQTYASNLRILTQEF